MQAVDEKRRKTEVGLRLAAVLGASAAGELPAEEDVVKSVPQDPTKREKLMVRSPRTGGVKVLEWLPDEQKWKVASDTAAEQTVQAAAEKSAEKNHKSSEQEREQIGELKRIVASLTEQVAAKDKMLMGHKSEVATELKRYREKHEALIVEYDTKKLEFENIRDVLETNIMEVEYRLEAAESMHELCLAAKEKAITKLSNLQSENTQLENELRELTMELNRTKAERDELFISQTKLENLEKKMKEETSQRKSLSLAPERQLEEKVESMEEQLKLVEEGRTQAEDNLRRLSLQYTELKQELLERESRLSNYREALEEKERLIGDLENRKADFARSFEQCEARVDRQREENQVLLKKLMDHDQVTVQQQQMQKRLEALEADLEQSKNKTQSGDRRNVELTAQKQHLHNQVKAALEKCNSARAEVEELAEAVEQSRRSEKQLKDENSKMQDQLRIFRQSSPGQNQEMIDLSVRLELAEKQNLKLAADYQAHRRFTKDMMEGGHQKLKDELADAKTSLDKLESKLYKTEKRLVDAQSRAERERSAREEKDEEISYLKQELYQARGGEDSKTTDMSRKTNPFGTALGSSASEHKKTPRESRPRPSKHTPSYMKKTANWTAKTGDETRSSSPSKIVGESPRRLDSSLKRTNSRTKLPKK
ncbi:hypothetical protein DIPPA_25341 [Diplonema papillatum]|nr:hypothetical protein DIPPA_25341 [Diplonema papillatum]